jgi:hypothetical protein
MSIEEEEENDISNILIDNETPLNSALNLSEEKPVVKHPKPLLKCVVCNDNAFGIIIFQFISFFKMNFLIF